MHPEQKRVFDDSARFKVLACGRRWGKTRLASVIALEKALHGGRVWWIGPTYKVAAIGWRLLKRLTAPLQPDKSETERRLQFPGGGEIWVKSADDPDSLRGEGLDLAIFDECAYIREETWTHVIRPALTDRHGGAVFISTPSGRNWFWRLYQRALNDDDWSAYTYPSSSNPFLDPAEIEAARELMPELAFRQEYLAEFLEHEGSVFRNILPNLYSPTEDELRRHMGHRIVGGVDWGKQNDYTVCSVGCADCRQELQLYRSREIDYAFQVQRIKALYDRWHMEALLVELNAMGEPVFEQLQREGLHVEGFTTSAQTKPPLIEDLALALEREEWKWLDEPEATGELEAYERKVNAVTNRSTYGAPDGMHDDTVMARALMKRAAGSGGLTIMTL